MAEIIEQGECGDNLTWTLDNEGLLTISGKGEMDYGYDRFLDSFRPSPFKNNTNIIKVEISYGVTNIASSAFAGCEALTNLHIRCEHPEDLEIDEEAFYKTNIENCTLYVPIGTGYAYRHHPVFSKFKEVIIEK